MILCFANSNMTKTLIASARNPAMRRAAQCVDAASRHFQYEASRLAGHSRALTLGSTARRAWFRLLAERNELDFAALDPRLQHVIDARLPAWSRGS